MYEKVLFTLHDPRHTSADRNGWGPSNSQEEAPETSREAVPLTGPPSLLASGLMLLAGLPTL